MFDSDQKQGIFLWRTQTNSIVTQRVWAVMINQSAVVFIHTQKQMLRYTSALSASNADGPW